MTHTSNFPGRKYEQLARGYAFGLVVYLLTTIGPFAGEANHALGNPYSRWRNGPPHDPSFFPIAVWLQSPAKARAYADAGINTYVGLWRGPTEEQLATLKAAGMHLICSQNATARRHLDDSVIIGWMHGDEPDNAQSLGDGKGYGPPIPAAQIVADYERLKAVDPSRPIMLNLGQGVAWDGWYGRGVRTRHPEDYPEYVKGCDIASFDIYPAAHDSPEVQGKLWLVARGVERLRGWTSAGQVVWNCIECTRINEAERRATPRQVKCEVWMSLVHESMGLIYFVHEWKPRFNESALLDDPDMLAMVTAVNRQITALAPVLNSPTLRPGAISTPDDASAPVATMLKRHEGTNYLFAVNLRGTEAGRSFTLPGMKGRRPVEVLGENRSLPSSDGTFADQFEPWDVHLYRVAAAAETATRELQPAQEQR